MAVLPPPTTATWPSFSRRPAFVASIQEMTGRTLPGISSLPGFHAPTARRIWVYPWAFSASTEGAGVFSRRSTPSFSRRAASLSMASALMRKSGITRRTTPPRASACSKRVTGTPARAQKKAAAMPVGPPPMTAARRLSRTGAGGRSFAKTSSYPRSAAVSFPARIWTGRS